MAELRKATQGDLDRVARCHRRAFPKALSSAMGLGYVKKMLEWYLVDSRAFMFLLLNGDECIGYCGGLKFDGTARVGSTSSMIQHSFGKAVTAFIARPWLLIHPEFIPKYGLALRNVRKRIFGLNTARTDTNLPLPEPHAGLIVIGVDPRHQGEGNGSKLIGEFERLSREMGFTKLQLTVKSDNEKAIKSYHRNGWSITESNQKSTSMVKQLP